MKTDKVRLEHMLAAIYDRVPALKDWIEGILDALEE